MIHVDCTGCWALGPNCGLSPVYSAFTLNDVRLRRGSVAVAVYTGRNPLSIPITQRALYGYGPANTRSVFGGLVVYVPEIHLFEIEAGTVAVVAFALLAIHLWR